MKSFQFRTSLGIPVSCEIFVRLDEFGLPEIERSVEIEGSVGNLILGQEPVDESEVLRIYRRWRGNPHNKRKIQRIKF